MARPKLAPFVTQALITLYARITKLGWFEFSPEKENDYIFRNVIGDVSQFLQVQDQNTTLFWISLSVYDCLFGLNIYVLFKGFCC